MQRLKSFINTVADVYNDYTTDSFKTNDYQSINLI